MPLVEAGEKVLISISVPLVEADAEDRTKVNCLRAVADGLPSVAPHEDNDMLRFAKRCQRSRSAESSQRHTKGHESTQSDGGK